jgi:hypothetical protein
MNYSFKSFTKKPLEERITLSQLDYSDWARPKQYDDWKYVSEDITPVQIRKEKKSRLKELEVKLKSHDYYYTYSDGRSYDKGKKSEEEIEDLVKEIDSMDGKTDAIKLYRKYLKKNEEVGEGKKLKDEKIKDKVHLNITMSGSGASLKKFLEDKKDPRPSDYQKHLEKKMREWKIKSSKELNGEALKRFWLEVDNEYENKDESVSECIKDVVVNSRRGVNT